MRIFSFLILVGTKREITFPVVFHLFVTLHSSVTTSSSSSPLNWSCYRSICSHGRPIKSNLYRFRQIVIWLSSGPPSSSCSALFHQLPLVSSCLVKSNYPQTYARVVNFIAFKCNRIDKTFSRIENTSYLCTAAGNFIVFSMGSLL